MSEMSMTRRPACQQPAHSRSPERSAWCRRLLPPAGRVLPGQPPAGDLFGPGRVAQVVDDEDIADIARHLGGDVGVALVYIEAVHPASTGFLKMNQPWLAAVGNIENPEPAAVVGLFRGRLEIGLLPIGAVLLAVHEQQVADDARLVAVRARIVEVDLRDHSRLSAIPNTQDRGSATRAGSSG